MSEEEKEQEATQPPLPAPVDDMSSPLRMFLTELNEVYQELRVVGFTEKIATSIVAHMLSDVMIDRAALSDDEYDEEDGENDYNDEQDTDDDDRGSL